jgi:hypothetical protein
LQAICLFLHDNYGVEPSSKVGKFINCLSEGNFLSYIAILDTVLKQIDLILLQFQKQNLDIGKVEICMKLLKEKLQNKELLASINTKLKELISEYESFLKIKNLEIKKVIIDQRSVLDVSNTFINSLLQNIDKRFPPNEVIDSFVNIFDPKRLKDVKFENEEWKMLRETYVKLVKNFKSRFSSFRYHQKIKDFNTFYHNIQRHLHSIHSYADLCSFLLTNHTFATCVTAVKMAHIGLLVPGSTSVVEGGFSIMNDVHSDVRNRMGVTMMNFILMCKVNVEDHILDDFFKVAALE